MTFRLTSKLSIWMLISLFALASCSKDSDTDTPAGGTGGIGGIGGGVGGGTGGGTGGGGGGTSRTAMLTAKNWSAISIQINPGIDINGDGTTETDLTPFYNPCALDDFYKFNTDMSYTLDEGASKCDPNSPQLIESGSWAWSTGETQLTLTLQQGTYSLAVTALSATQMTTTQAITLNNANYTLTVGYN